MPKALKPLDSPKSEPAIVVKNSIGLAQAHEPSPPRQKPIALALCNLFLHFRLPASEYIHIHHLKRPFTLPSLHALLRKFGEISEEEFWIDNIKSNCIVKVGAHKRATNDRNYPAFSMKILKKPSSRAKSFITFVGRIATIKR